LKNLSYMSIAKYKLLLRKSISAAVSSIEIYNKPDFKYREESFIILLVNSYELLFKAKLIKESNIKSLYFKEPKLNKKGEKTKQKVLAKSKSGNLKTIDIFRCIKKLRNLNINIEKKLYENIEAIVEIRDNAVHFCNEGKMLDLKIQTLGTASLMNYLKLVDIWFEESLDKYNFYLMPVSFYNEIEGFDLLVSGKQNKEVQNLVKYLAGKENSNPFSKKSDFHFTVNLNINIKKSATEGQVSFVKTNDPNAPKLQMSEEDIRERFQLDDSELFSAVKSKNPKIKKNQQYYEKRGKYIDNSNLCYKRYPDPRTKKGTPKKFYSNNVADLIVKDFES
jgi:hypothetical protein